MKAKRLAVLLVRVIFTLVLWFYSIAWMVFMWRNPKANMMSYFREFPQVVCFEKMETYQ